MNTVLGHGIYSPSEASRLLGVPARTISAWFHGWPGGREAVFQRDYAELTASPAISFLDLVDVSVAASLRRRGASFPTIRRLKTELSDYWKTEHPFGRQELYTDDTGRRIFLQAVTAAGETALMEVLQRQHAMPQVLLPFLKRVEYDPETHFAHRMTLTHGVVLDPRRRYGKPIVAASGMPTAILYSAYLANGKRADVAADWYGVAVADVERAVAFEMSFSGIAGISGMAA